MRRISFSVSGHQGKSSSSPSSSLELELALELLEECEYVWECECPECGMGLGFDFLSQDFGGFAHGQRIPSDCDSASISVAFLLLLSFTFVLPAPVFFDVDRPLPPFVTIFGALLCSAPISQKIFPRMGNGNIRVKIAKNHNKI